MKNVSIVIPAIKKRAVIPDQLVKKLNGKILIQRAIDTSKEIVSNEQILVVTDSEEISLICERNKIKFYYDKTLNLDSNNILDVVNNILKTSNDIILFRANTPLIKAKTIKDAYHFFKKNKNNIIISSKKVNTKLFKFDNGLIFQNGDFYEELKSFYIYNQKSSKEFIPFEIKEEEAIEIESYQDWWICEKLLQRKRIVFNVIGNVKVGMGHIYRALSLAHEITDHEIIFVCSNADKLAVDKIASKDYKVIESENVKKTILELKPDILINDILNTNEKFILTLKKQGIKIVNFEDLGSGAKYANIVFNELYETPILEYKNILWGSDWYFLRDEFDGAEQNNFEENVKNVLITFGGTDQHNLTLISLKAIYPFIQEKNINVQIICGGGYLYKEELNNYLKESEYKNIEVNYQTAIISKKMENIQLAITSNGRTVYELAHMHIPSIVISQHERENTHKFSKLENGFINLGIIDKNIYDKIQHYVKKMIYDKEYRYLLYLNSLKFHFLNNKKRVINKIMELL